MNILHQLTRKSLKANRTRTIVTIVGILLSAALFCSVTTLAFSIRSYLIDLQLYHGGDYHVKCHRVAPSRAQDIRSDEQIASAAESKVLGVVNLNEAEAGVNTGVLTACNSEYFKAMPVRIEEGRLPENSGEILISGYWHKVLPLFGMNAEIGDTVSFEVVPYISSIGAGTPEAAAIKREYTIVGILKEEFTYASFYCDDSFQMLYTCDDGKIVGELYSDFYLKGKTPYSAFRIAEKYNGIPNTLLLSYYGASKTSAEQYLLLGTALVIMLIIMMGSSGLIHNAFAVSVSQREKEFGILSGVGATAKQIRKSVWYEAWILCALGIPLGLLAGYGGMAAAITCVGNTIQGMIPVTAPGVALQAKGHPLAFAGAALVSVITVFLSARKPMQDAKKVSPITAIRQNDEFVTLAMGKRRGKQLEKSKNIPSGMAQKYYSANRKKFNRVVFSLAMSIILFLLATTVSGQFRAFADSGIQEESFDFLVTHSGGDEALLSAATTHDSILRKAAYTTATGQLALTDSAFSQEKLKADKLMNSYSPEAEPPQTVFVYYLEDAVLKGYLAEHGIDPAPYMRTENPLALVCQKTLTTPYIQSEDGSWAQYHLQFYPLSDDVSSLTVYDADIPEELRAYLDKKYTTDRLILSAAYHAEENGALYYHVQVEVIVEDGSQARPEVIGTDVFLVETDESKRLDNFYYVKNGVADQTPAAAVPHSSARIPLGARIKELPFGISQDTSYYSSCVSLILPLSATEKSASAYAMQTKDYLATKKHLDTFSQDNVTYNDYLAKEFQSRNTAKMIDVFSYTFLLLITAICATNIFNTISTGLALRRRDFGILKSIGMTDAQLRKMVATECLQSGWHAILWGLPIGCILSVLLNKAAGNTYHLEYALSLKTILFCVICVGVTTGISMLYALHKVKNDTPIDAIRMDSI